MILSIIAAIILGANFIIVWNVLMRSQRKPSIIDNLDDKPEYECEKADGEHFTRALTNEEWEEIINDGKPLDYPWNK